MAFDEQEDTNWFTSDESPFAVIETHDGKWVIVTDMCEPFGGEMETKEDAFLAVRELEACFLRLVARGIIQYG